MSKDPHYLLGVFLNRREPDPDRPLGRDLDRRMTAAGRTWARIARSSRVLVTATIPPGTRTDTRESSMLLEWSESDPACVALKVADPWAGGPDVEWFIARNLFAAAHMPGLDGETVGRGDVKVRCSAGETTVWLNAPEGRATLVMPSENVLALLREAEAITPLGEAEAVVYADAIEAELAALMLGTES